MQDNNETKEAQALTMDNLNDVEWENKHNLAFYEDLSIEKLKEFAVMGGLENGCDVDLIYDELKPTDSVLEVGGGYGRVLNHLLSRGYEGKLSCIEWCRGYYDYLLNKYGNRVHLYYQDLINFQPNEKYDAILWMWCGISDFGKDEQLGMLKKLKSVLKPGGKIFVDTFKHDAKPVNSFIDKKNCCYIKASGVVGCHQFIKPEELEQHASSLLFSETEKTNYQTNNERERLMFTLKC